MGKITINEIAKIANVSKSTISRVLNKSGPVSTKTKKAVLDAIDALDYKPNEIARSLATKRTKTIGLIIQDVRNLYYAQACWHTERILRKMGYTTIICNADNDPVVEESFLTGLKYRNVDGILCIGIQEDATSILNFKSKEEIPLVLVDRMVKGYPIPAVNLDNEYGGRLVADYLFSLGHTNIAFITSDFTEAERTRFEGFRAAFQARNLHLEDRCIIKQSEELWHQGTCEPLVRLLRESDRPTALFASNDYKALRVLRILRQHNISVPGDISVVGYDDIETASIVHPALTTVHQPIDKMVELGTRRLLKLIDGEREIDEQQVLQPWLVERESTRRLR